MKWCSWRQSYHLLHCHLPRRRIAIMREIQMDLTPWQKWRASYSRFRTSLTCFTGSYYNVTSGVISAVLFLITKFPRKLDSRLGKKRRRLIWRRVLPRFNVAEISLSFNFTESAASWLLPMAAQQLHATSNWIDTEAEWTCIWHNAVKRKILTAFQHRKAFYYDFLANPHFANVIPLNRP